MTANIYKYPKTYHVEDSGIASKSQRVPFSSIVDCWLAVEEKMDGANAAISFSSNGQLLLQSRGHYLTEGKRERHFNLFKHWAYALAPELFNVLGTRYILYGEWLYAKHTIFYNYLPHYFLEYDVLDVSTGEFLDTPSRQQLLQDLPITSVPVLYRGRLQNKQQLQDLIGISQFIKPPHITGLKRLCDRQNINSKIAIAQTDNSNLMEGLYIKVEENGKVRERYKYIRAEFLHIIKQASGHWLDRPLIANQLQPGVSLFA